MTQFIQKINKNSPTKFHLLRRQNLTRGCLSGLDNVRTVAIFFCDGAPYTYMAYGEYTSLLKVLGSVVLLWVCRNTTPAKGGKAFVGSCAVYTLYT